MSALRFVIKILKQIFEIVASPITRFMVMSILTVVIGVLSSLTASDISSGKLTQYSDWYKNIYALLLVLSSVVWLFLQAGLYKVDLTVSNFSDNGYCLAYIRKAQLEAVAKDLKSNPSSARLLNADELLKKLRVAEK